MAKYCANCGTEIKEGMTRCPNCSKSFVEEKKETNAMAIAGLICAFLFPLLGLIFSIVGLKKSKELNNGKEMSVVGIVVSSLALVFALIVMIFVFIFTAAAIANSDKIEGAINSTVDKVPEIIERFDEQDTFDFD